jgi:hypothetical protein
MKTPTLLMESDRFLLLLMVSVVQRPAKLPRKPQSKYSTKLSDIKPLTPISKT